MNTPERTEAYRKVLELVCIDPEATNYSGAEDAAEWLSGEREIARFCVVTNAGEFAYAYAHDETLEAAKERAIQNINDDVFAEAPILIIDLDTGKKYQPDFTTIQWKEQTEE